MTTSLPPYQLRVSTRARMVRLTITREKGLVVTVPAGFRMDLLSEILASKSDWIAKSIRKLEAAPVLEKPKPLPTELRLLAINETWQIVYKLAPGRVVTLTEKPRHVLMLEGKVKSVRTVRALLNRWMRIRAQQVLPDWLNRLSQSTRLPFNDVSIRDQRTRWGSCSSAKNINLNQKLLFLPPDLVDYIVIHELCHTVQMSHSKNFWNLVGKYLPDYLERRKRLRVYEKEITW